MKYRLIAAALLGLLLMPMQAYAQAKTKAQLTTEINTNLASSSNITAAQLRATVLDIVNSYFDLNGGTALNCTNGQLVSGLPTLSSITCAQPGAALVTSVNVDFNAINDYALVIPPGITRWGIQAFRVINTGTTASLTTAQYGIFTAQSGGGTAIVASGSSLSALTSNAATTAGGQMQPGLTLATAYFTASTIYFRVTQVQGAAASGAVYLVLIPYL